MCITPQAQQQGVIWACRPVNGGVLPVVPEGSQRLLLADPYGLPSLREHVQKHTAGRFDSPLWQAQSWTDVANEYLDLAQWGPPPWTELQWVTLRNVIELAEGDY